MATLLGTNISPTQGTFEDDFPFPKVGYVIVPWRGPFHQLSIHSDSTASKRQSQMYFCPLVYISCSSIYVFAQSCREEDLELVFSIVCY